MRGLLLREEKVRNGSKPPVSRDQLNDGKVPVAAVQAGFTVKNFDTPSSGHRYGRCVSFAAG